MLIYTVSDFLCTLLNKVVIRLNNEVQNFKDQERIIVELV